VMLFVTAVAMPLRLTQRAPDPWKSTRTVVVGLPLRGVRVFRRFSWLKVDPVKVALSRPTHQYPEGA
jgi:hypothetical protein